MEEQSVQCSITDINSEEPAKSEVLQSDQPRKNRICLIGDIRNNSLISAAAQKFGVPVLTSDTGIEYSGDDKVYCTYFVLQSFDGSVYEALPKKSHRILGPTALLQLANRGDALPRIHRPMYSISLLGKVIVFTGFRNKSELSSLVHKIHGMGGSIKNEMSERVTHLIANCYASDDKYKYALIFKLSIMSKNWIDQLWEERDNPIIFGDNEAITSRNKLPLFFNSKICFFGFPEEEKIHMVEVLEQQGGTPIDINGPECTHVINHLENNNQAIDELNCGKQCCLHPHELLEKLKNKYDFKIMKFSNNSNILIFLKNNYKVNINDSFIDKTLPGISTTIDSFESSSKDSAICMDFTNESSYNNSTPISNNLKRKSNVNNLNCSDMSKNKLSLLSTNKIAKPRCYIKWKKSKTIKLNQFKKNEYYSQSDLSSFNNNNECLFLPNKSPITLHKYQCLPKKLSKSFNSILSGINDSFKLNNNSSIITKSNLSNITLDNDSFHEDHKFIVNSMNTTWQETDEDYKQSQMVVDESNSNILQELGKMDVVKGDSVASSCRRRAQIVKAEWFWTSVQNQDIAHERDYKINLESVMSPSAFARRDSQQTSTPTSASTKRKRKRFPENIVSLIQNAESPTVYKRRSSISDAGFLSVSGSFLDATASPDKHALDDIPEVEAANTGPKKDKPRRYPVFLELLNTEKNYVEILNAIITFQKQLDDLIDTPGELINATERKLIFGNVSIIHDTHKKMLEEFKHHCTNWKDDTSIGAIYLSHLPGLVKVYPPYINFLSNAYETLKKLDAERPRFHAFLKICQSKPQSQRQPLHELLLRPFQRLGSTILLLEEIHRHTDINNPDHSSLKLAIEGLKKATSHVDEDKRKTEEQVSIFCIFNDIDNCPAYLVSSHRSFIDKYEVIDLNKDLSGRGTHLTLFLFSDTLEICKKKSKFNSLKSPNMMNGTNIVNGSNTMTKHNQEKLYRHVEMLSLRDVKKVFDIQETEGCSNVFALKVRSNQEIKEKLFSFAMTDERSNKTNFLKSLCRQMANTICIADADIFLISLHSSDLKIDTSEVATGTLGKAFKFATKTKKNLTRALSINKTPSKLKRAMSTMMSPFGSTTSLSHSTSLTPISGLAGMRLASCNNMNELAKGETDSPSSRDNVLVAPMSVQPTRKAKCGTLSMASLRRL